MNNFHEELKLKSCFHIAGIIGLDGLPRKYKYPNSKEKQTITENHFLWVLNNPNPSNFSILFYFYPIQVKSYHFYLNSFSIIKDFLKIFLQYTIKTDILRYLLKILMKF